jgi:hypothetical protein
MLAACPAWEGDSTRGAVDKDAGTMRHEALAALLRGDETPLAGMETDQADAVRWAAEHVLGSAPTSLFPIQTELRINPVDEDFQPYFPNGGSIDVACGDRLYDLKWRQRDYNAQCAAYALGYLDMTGLDQISFTLLFGATKRAVTRSWTRAEAQDAIGEILANARRPDAQPTPCDYCAWCAKVTTCPALLARANAVAAGRDDYGVSQWHGSKIETADDMGAALDLARAVKKWAESIDHHAMELAVKRGVVATGYALATRKGNRTVSDVVAAFGALSRLGVSQLDFLALCGVSLTDLIEYEGKRSALGKTDAEKSILAALGDLVTRGPDSKFLRKTKDKA